MSEKANFRALLPMIVFLVLFIGTGIALTAAGADMPFYQLSATVAIIPAIVLAILQGKDDLNKKIGVFLSGVPPEVANSAECLARFMYQKGNPVT